MHSSAYLSNSLSCSFIPPQLPFLSLLPFTAALRKRVAHIYSLFIYFPTCHMGGFHLQHSSETSSCLSQMLLNQLNSVTVADPSASSSTAGLPLHTLWVGQSCASQLLPPSFLPRSLFLLLPLLQALNSSCVRTLLFSLTSCLGSVVWTHTIWYSLMLLAPTLTSAPDQGSAGVFCEGPDDSQFRLLGHGKLCYNYSVLLL